MQLHEKNKAGFCKKKSKFFSLKIHGGWQAKLLKKAEYSAYIKQLSLKKKSNKVPLIS